MVGWGAPAMLLEENDPNAVCASFGVKEDIYFYQGGRWL